MKNLRKQGGYTLIELLVSATIIGLLLALAIPNLIKARISANEANARKAMQVLRDAEFMYFTQDLDGDGIENFTLLIGDLVTSNSLRCPVAPCLEENSTIDDTFQGAVAFGATAICIDNKAGYCFQFANELLTSDASFVLQADFGWKGSPASTNVSGRKDFAIYSDGSIRCSTSLVS